MLDFEKDNPTDWNRTKDSLEFEWNYHDFFTGWPVIGDNGQHVMLDNDGGDFGAISNYIY